MTDTAAPTADTPPNSTSNSPSNPNDVTPPAKHRSRLLIIATIVIAIALIGYGIWWYIFARHYESTDDAYVSGNVVQVTPLVAGTVLSIHADDTELVKAGAPLIDLDQTDGKVALAQAEAQLAQTVRDVRQLYVTNNTLRANINLRNADVVKARTDLARRTGLIGTGAVSAEDVSHARSALQAAEAALKATLEQLATNQILTDNTTIANYPSVRRAATQVEAAYLALERTAMVAPISGYIAKRSVQVGQRVAPGAPLLSIVPLDSLWVDANFKEVQVAHMRIGQPVELHSDLYGSGVVYHGKVIGMAAGTGSAFALLPAQNASGNWIKVVQRIPVRIALDAEELKQRPLRVGLSMQVEVDIANAEGNSLTSTSPARTEPAYQTKVFENTGSKAQALIARIIAANSGKS